MLLAPIFPGQNIVISRYSRDIVNLAAPALDVH